MNALLPLVKAGIPNSNSTATWRRRGGKALAATVEDDGRLMTADGRAHRWPSWASKHHTHKPMDGWSAWSLSDGRRPSGLRAEIGGSRND